MKNKLKSSQGKGIKKIMIVVDQDGIGYDWYRELPKKLKDKYEYHYVGNDVEAKLLEQKLLSSGRLVSETHIYR